MGGLLGLLLLPLDIGDESSQSLFGNHLREDEGE
jgi:hypothetical protein